jgi:uncharacterized protein (DUF2147 family)
MAESFPTVSVKAWQDCPRQTGLSCSRPPRSVRTNRPMIARVVEKFGPVLCLALASTGADGADAASATPHGVSGFWQEPAGAVIQIAPCKEGLCLKIVSVPPGDHPRTDVHNPDERLRGRALCGLSIGQDFRQTDAQHADDGHIYDPRSGRTYSGSLTAEGNTLKLRGYVGIRLLGRTEIWTRSGPGYAKCPPG